MSSRNLSVHDAVERISQDELNALQSKRLREVVHHVFEKNPVQRERFVKAGIHPEEVRGLEDLQRRLVKMGGFLPHAGK